MLDNVSPESAVLLILLQDVFGLPTSGLGAVALSNALISDIAYVSDLPVHHFYTVWLESIQKLYGELIKLTGATPAQDRDAVSGLRLPKIRMMLANPKNSIPSKVAGVLHCLRGVFAIKCLADRTPVGTDMGCHCQSAGVGNSA